MKSWTFPPRSRIKQGFLLLSFLVNKILRVLDGSLKQEKEIKAIQTAKEGVKWSVCRLLYTHTHTHTHIYTHTYIYKALNTHLKNYYKKINKISKVAGHKIYMQKH